MIRLYTSKNDYFQVNTLTWETHQVFKCGFNILLSRSLKQGSFWKIFEQFRGFVLLNRTLFLYVWKTNNKANNVKLAHLKFFNFIWIKTLLKTNYSVHTFCRSFAKLHGVLSQNVQCSPKVKSSRILKMFLKFHSS